MQANDLECPPSDFKNLKLCNILSEFQVDNQKVMVVSLEDTEEVFPLENIVELERFKVQDQWCAIIKTGSITTPEEDSTKVSLATLLTERELQIATLVASGYGNKQIAHQLCISEWTVSTHLRRIFMKLGVDSRAAMVYRCASLIQTTLKM